MLVIGQSLNSSTPLVHEALANGSRPWVVDKVRAQVAAGADVIDCCAASFAGSEEAVLSWLLEMAEAATNCPLSIDSADASILARLGVGRRQTPWLNSLDADAAWPSPVLSLARSGNANLVVQLRGANGSIPKGLDDRRSWTERCVSALDAGGIPIDRVWIDPVLLPWGADLEAGRDLLAFLESMSREMPRLQTVVGLSNVSYGHTERSRLHREWLSRLRAAGLSAVILDPLEPGLVGLAKGPSSA